MAKQGNDKVGHGGRDAAATTREERLAAQLRANLRRRKAQARGMTQAATDIDSDKEDGEDSVLPPGPKQD